jgi:hypothetical protein
MDADELEYARFGPWAIEISDEDPLPRLFAPYLTRSEPPLLAVKIPRHLERRDARPGMDLYDYLVALYEDDLVVLQRVGRDVRSDTYLIRDVQHLRVTSSLLYGALHFAVPGHRYDLPYNTVAERLMLRLADLIRARYTEAPLPGAPAWELELPTGLLSFLFEHRLDRQRRRAGMRLLAFQQSMPVAPAVTSTLRRSLFRVADKRRTEAMHCSDDRELMVITRERPYRYRWETQHGYEVTYVPVRNLTDVARRTDPANAATELRLSTRGGDTVYPFDHENATLARYADYLSSLVRPADHPAAARTDRPAA